MPRQPSTKINNSFIKGLFTEATGLNFPEDACTDSLNCVFSKIGSAYLRKGIDFEDRATFQTIDRTNKAVSYFLWKDVASDANLTLFVLQVGPTLYFWDTTRYANVSLGYTGQTVDLTAFKPAGAPDPDAVECQFESGHGVLFVYHPTLESFYVEYDLNSNTITSTQINIKIRDFVRQEDSLETDQRPVTSLTAMDDKHHYNLLNQGWTEERLQQWDAARSDMPSNADVMWYFKNVDEQFDLTVVDDRTTGLGNSPASNGHFIYSLFNQDRSGKTGIPNLDNTDTSFNRVSTGAFFAGRVWYAGIEVQSFKGHLFFSPIIEDLKQFGTCHQLNDPTSETLFDLLPSDGGAIVIADAGIIHKLVSIGSSLLVFANNGVWEITGSQGVGFQANDYVIRKISEVPAISPSSFVLVESVPFWWNYDGIYTIQAGAQGAFAVTPLTDATIKGYYINNIDFESKLYAKGAYNRVDKTVQWVFRSTKPTTVSERYAFDGALTFNLQTSSFSPWSLSDGATINGVFSIPNVGEFLQDAQVVDANGVPVVDVNGNPVLVVVRAGEIKERFIYLTSKDATHAVSFALEFDTNYVDWASITGVDYGGFFISGYSVQGEGNRKFQTNYINVYVDSSTTGEFYVSSLWDYANTGDTGRWSNPQKVTYSNTNYNFTEKRLKLRGDGKAVQIKIESSPGKSFNVIGWSIFETANRWV